ncbi:MAG: hypothetical protein J7513_10685 [Solirubrobacteraceae bacterium]|nr:hypothetical protein [Solirubrobacteraceae bacterium]
MEAIAAEAAKYRLPGMALGEGPSKPGEKPQPVAPMNLAQLRSWIEHGGSIDILA